MEMNPTTKTTQNPDTDTETPPQAKPLKSLSFTNGSLKPHQRHPADPPPQPRQPLAVVSVSYKECLKNHAASMGGLALDGCGEFLPSPTATHSDPTSLKCAACGCHRNFHRRDSDDLIPRALNVQHLSSTSQSPSPVCSPPPVSHLPPSQYYFSSIPQTLLSLSTASPRQYDEHHKNSHPTLMRTESGENPLGRKRFRTKFSQEQKEKMFQFCEKLGWKMPKSNEMLVEEFCNEVGVDRRVLKVWMHNNKNPLRKREMGFGQNGNGNGDRVSFETSDYCSKKESEYINGVGSGNLHVSANGSSSSS
ncbi:zinc-finger homeodomain protein 11-like [Corylus avellana]|uniref:zinc-finger homeodomain protein 11-like n=1 Tax=Corylus avellana TaxID=13451 RepID=UPI00286A7CFF|nr:zinc-finger homeodomain protein 11-like [Corylus avellana]